MPLSRSDKASINSSRSSIAGWLLTNISRGRIPANRFVNRWTYAVRYRPEQRQHVFPRQSPRVRPLHYPIQIRSSSLMTFASVGVARNLHRAFDVGVGCPASLNPRLSPIGFRSAGSLRFTETSPAMRRPAPLGIAGRRAIGRPIIHQSPALLEQISSPISRFDLVADCMSKCHFDKLSGIRSRLRRPVTERRPKAVSS